MVRPGVTARVKKPGEFACIPVEPGNVRALEPVAVRASRREIFLDGLSAMFLSEDYGRSEMVTGEQLGESGSTRNDRPRVSRPSGQVPDSLGGDVAEILEAPPRS